MIQKTEIELRIEKVRQWDKRITKLKKRKIDPLNERKFCKKYDLCFMQFNRHKHLKAIPSKKVFDFTELAFEKENV
jgi:hypothetical protein